jgi:hypothetical protein
MKASVAYLRQCFALLPGGVLQWKVRPRSHFKTEAAWLTVNTLRAGHIAGCVGKFGYEFVGVGGTLMPTHVVVFTLTRGHYPVGEIDHRDRNRTNNDPRNLRDVTRPQNMWNMGAHRDSSTGVKGVWRMPNGKYRARIHHGRHIHIGVFDAIEDAQAAYNRHAKALRKEFHHA